MAGKRPFPDAPAAGDHNADDAPANAPRGPRDPSGPRGPKRMRPSGSNLPLHAPEGGGAKANLKRIRDLKRLLAKADMPATVRADLEKELQARHDKRGEKKVSAKRASMISRYHMVRFFGACQILFPLTVLEQNKLTRRREEKGRQAAEKGPKGPRGHRRRAGKGAAPGAGAGARH